MSEPTSDSQRRQRALRDQYEADGHATHYASKRWTESRHARKTHAWEMRVVEDLLLKAIQAGGPLERVLDCPCGHGRFAELLSKHSQCLIQADLAAAMLAERERPAAWSGQASLLALPFADDAVDLAFCFRVLHHFPERALRRQAIAELGRVSRKFVLTTYYDAQSFPVWRDRMRGREHRLTPCSHADFVEDAAAAGLRVVKRQPRRRWLSQQVLVLLARQ